MDLLPVLGFLHLLAHEKKDYDDWSKIYPGFSSSGLNQGIFSCCCFFHGKMIRDGYAIRTSLP